MSEFWPHLDTSVLRTYLRKLKDTNTQGSWAQEPQTSSSPAPQFDIKKKKISQSQRQEEEEEEDSDDN